MPTLKATRPRPRLSRDTYVLGVIAFFVMVGFGVVVPVLPIFARSFGVGFTEVGAVISAFALMRLVASPCVATLINIAGEKNVLVTGIAIVALSSGGAGLAHDYLSLLLLRAAGGIGSALFSVSAMTLVLATAAPTARARSIGFYQGGFLIGGMAGPAVGGALAAISLTAPFFFYAATLAIAGFIGFFLLKKTKHRRDPDRKTEEPGIPFSVVIRDRRYQTACLANFAQGWTSLGVRGALVPLVVVELLREPSSWTGIAFACAAVAQTVALAPATRFVDTVGRRPAIVAACAVAAVVVVLFPLAPNIWVLIFLLCLYGVAAAFMGTAPAAAVGDAAGEKRGRPVAIFSMFSDGGAIVGPLVAGILADSFSYPVAFAVGAVFLAATAIYAVWMPKTMPT